MKTWMRIALAAALVASTQVSCSVNDYCLNCDKGDGGGSGSNDSGIDAGSADAMPDAGCVPTGTGEVCNGKDDDCNGLVDDGVLPQVGDLCANQNGACAGGVYQCTGGELKCSKQPSPEICDGIDNNCSGPTSTSSGIDEGDPGGGGKCGTDQGECVAGQFHCDPTTGTIKCFGFVDHTTDPELCNAKDDDCDGTFDEDVVFTNPNCGPTTSTGECNIGTLVCQGGAPVCTNAVFPKFETCNGLDDNCDGNIDEIFNKQTDVNHCGSCTNVCPAVTNANKVCSAGVCGYTCQPGYQDLNGLASDGCEHGPCFPSGAEVCDNVDNDCNGVVDDNLTPPAICKGLGECSTTSFGNPTAPGYKVSNPPTAMCSGAAGWTCTYPGTTQFPGETRCDGLDNNCDGNIDENQPNLGQACHEDRENPLTQCTGDSVDNDLDGFVNDGCPAVGAAETNCADTVDDDSDGTINDGCPAKAQQGICQGSGAYACDPQNLNGAAYCAITTPGSTPAANESCNAKDDDCDGKTDEATNGTLLGQEWVNIGNGKQMMKYEASRPDSTPTDTGSSSATVCSQSGAETACTGDSVDDDADGFVNDGCAAVGAPEVSCNDTLDNDSDGTINDGCPTHGVLPWTNVKYQDALAACQAIGATLCTEQQWHRTCSVISPTSYPLTIAAAGTFIEAEDYYANSYAGAPETICNEATTGVDNDGDGLVNDGCPIRATSGPTPVLAAETGGQCTNAVDDDGDGFVNDGCPAIGPQSWVEDYTTGFSGISAMEAVGNLGGTIALSSAPTQSPRMDYQVTVATGGTYHVFLKMFANTTADNTAYVSVTQATPPQTPAASVTTISNGSWQWRDASTTFALTAGTWTVSVYMGKDGVKVDKLYLSTSATTPTDALSSAGFKWAYASNQNTYQPNTCNGHDYQQFNVASVSRTNTGVATVTTATAHSFVVGGTVQILGTTPSQGSFDGVYTVTGVTSTTFTYQQTTTVAVANTATAGTATDATDNILTTGSLANCKANTDTGVFDMSGNVREWTMAHAPGENPIRGGAANGTADGISCPLNFTLADDTFFFPNIGFRCCRTFP